MNILVAMLVATNTIASEPPETSGCNEVQERIVKRVQELRKYEKGELVTRCHEGDMRFYDTNPQFQDYERPFGFVTGQDGITYMCRIESEKEGMEPEILCRNPKNEEETIEAFRRMYGQNKFSL